ncbi:MAG TPA: prepilin-type N-terminal cleavage/methylation domain-containing protein [Actinomycetota bacterium]|nr:prepilin-type N-terminal cleavage/methylation domain-containing protein [Actinomycetota bacterium]
MFQRFHEMRERDERGFTLIELLVVILIIAILAAIAIPVFLRQREKGWIAAMESSLKDAATAAESFATGCGNGSYTVPDPVADNCRAGATAGADISLDDLQDEGWNPTAEVDLTVTVDATGDRYCLEAVHDRYEGDEEPMRFDSSEGQPISDPCTLGATTTI